MQVKQDILGGANNFLNRWGRGTSGYDNIAAGKSIQYILQGFAPEFDTSSDRSDAVVLGGGIELICILDSASRAADAAAAAGGLIAAIYGLLSRLLL